MALPFVFVPLGTFILTQCFKAIPNDVIDAARLDGCGTLGLLFRVAVPMNKSGLICTFLLSFLDSWNMVEQPLTYLKDYADYPFSVGLAVAMPQSAGIGAVCCVLAALPPLFMFARFRQELTSGIEMGVEK